MSKCIRDPEAAETVGLAPIRRRLLFAVLLGLTIVLVVGAVFWAVAGGRVASLPVMGIRFWYLGAAILAGFGIVYLLAKKGYHQAGAIILLLIITSALFLVDYPANITRGRGLLLAAIPIVISAAILPSRATPIVGFVITLLTIGLSAVSLHQPPDYPGVIGMLIITAVCWVSAFGLEMAINALENNLQTRQEAQEALRRRLANEHLLSQLSTRLLALQPAETGVSITWALEMIGQQLQVDRCYISLLSTSGDITSHAFEWHAERVQPLDDLAPSQVLDSLVWSRIRFAGSEGLAVNDISRLENASEIEKNAWSGVGVRSILAVPVVLQQALLGFIACQTEVEQRSWMDDETKLLQLAAGILANALARSQAESELHLSEERLKLALTGADLGIYDLNLDTDVMYVNDRYLTMLGYKPDELHLNVSSFMELVHPDDRERLDKLYIKQRKTKDRVPEIEYRLLAKDGRYRWIQDRGQTIRYPVDNRPVRIAGTCSDITLRKHMEEEIQAAELRYRNLVEHLPAIVYLLRDENMVYVSPQVSSIFGYSQEEYLVSPTRWLDLIHPEDKKLVRDVFANRADKQSVNLEYRVCHKDGSIIWVHDESVQIQDASGKFDYVQGIIQNITERVLAEQAIRESQTNLMLAQQIAGVGGWALDATTGQLSISDDLFRTLDMTDKTDLPVYPDTLQLYIHPDYWPSLQSAIDSALAGGPDVDMRVRAYMPGDIPFYVHIKSISIRDSSGKVQRLVGMIQDLSSTREREEAFQECQSELTLIRQIAHLGVWRVDISSQRITLSEGAQQVLGSRTEMPQPLSWFYEQLAPPDGRLLEETLQRLDSGSSQFDFQLHLGPQASGKMVRLIGTCIRDDGQHVTTIVGTLQEIF